jgi:hypothetical protein
MCETVADPLGDDPHAAWCASTRRAASEIPQPSLQTVQPEPSAPAGGRVVNRKPSSPRIHTTVHAAADRSRPLPTALIRPDGYVAWVGDGSDSGLRDALTTWFGPPAV